MNRILGLFAACLTACVCVSASAAADITVRVAIESVTGWTNFEALKVMGTISDFQGGVFTTGATNMNIVVTAGDGSSVTQQFAYAVDDNGRFAHIVDGLVAGDSYDVMAFLTIEGAEVETISENVDGITARTVDGWIYEDDQTFAELAPRSGIWGPATGIAEVTNEVIGFTAQNWEKILMFQPTNDSPVIRASDIKDLHYKVMFASPGLYTYEPFAAVPEDWFAAVTLVADDEDCCRFAVVSNGVWIGVDSSIEAKVGYEYDMMIRIERDERTNVVYWVVDGGKTNRLASCPCQMPTEEVALPMVGYGAVAEIRGLCQDVNLLQVGDEEFATLDDARATAGETMDITPLWHSRFEVSGRSGRFRIVKNSFLELLWKKWHHVFVTEDGNVHVYDYLSGNNWIEYADVAGVETNLQGEVIVNTPEGLAWIAESATNGWYDGTVVLGRDIDLSEMNWTPVAQFTGTFDGKGRTITGLNNTNEVVELGSAGVYLAGPTNAWGRSAYGLFATATNVVFRNVTLADVAIDNYASSVSALLGMHLGGDLSVSNVMLASGNVVGEEGVVAGIVGTTEGWGNLMVVDNTNAANVRAVAEVADDSRWAAGIMTVGGTEESVGALVVTGNVNRGTVANVLYNNDNGGNVAQILAGTTWGTTFGEINVTNNVAEGEVQAEINDHDGWYLGEYDAWVTEVFPVCNLAPAVTYFTEADGYRRFVEANNVASVPVDPVYGTARMLAGVFQNGARNYAGEWMDTISAMHEGDHLWITGERLTNDTWQTVTVDRSISFDLCGNTICTVYDDTTFRIICDACLTISNGTILVAEGGQAFDCEGASSVKSNNLHVVCTAADFFDRVAFVDDMPATMDMLFSTLSCLPSGTTIAMDDDTGLSFDSSANAFTMNGARVASLAGFRSLAPQSSSYGNVSYVVELNEQAVPTFDLDVAQATSSDGAVNIRLTKTHAGLYYAVQHKASLVENWSEPAASDWQYVETDGTPITFELPAEGASGFYRIKVTDHEQ